jgi:hypothetical protein
MKAKINIQTIIISVIFILQFSNIFASSDGASLSPRKEFNISLAPSTPKEATFEEITESNATIADFSLLAPVTPKEATFNDDTDADYDLMINDLAPVTPAEADFNENDGISLAPTTPKEADFE